MGPTTGVRTLLNGTREHILICPLLWHDDVSKCAYKMNCLSEVNTNLAAESVKIEDILGRLFGRLLVDFGAHFGLHFSSILAPPEGSWDALRGLWES